MQLYIENILPRLKQFSQDLDKKEFFIETPWIYIDEDLNRQKYIFKRNGDLIMSCNGHVTIGKWEYLSIAKSLLIDRITDKILLNQFFIDSAIMVLKLDGNHDNFILANELIIPDFNVIDYLKKIYYEKNNISTIELENGVFLEILNYQGSIIKSTVNINGESVKDGVLKNTKYSKKYVIKDSKITKVLVDHLYKTDKGDLVVEIRQYMDAMIDDNVYLNNSSAPDGKYKRGFMDYLYVRDGKITTKKIFNKY